MTGRPPGPALEADGRDLRLEVWALVGTAMVAQASVSVAELGIPTLAPFLKHGLRLSAAGVGVLVAAVNCGRIFGSFPAGRLADRIGEPPVMVAACLGVSVFLACATLPSGAAGVGLLLIGLGLFAGAAAPAGSRFVLSAFSRHRRGVPMGLRQSAVPLGGLTAALLLPAAADRWGFRAAFLLAAGLALGGALVVLRMTRRRIWTPSSRRARGDVSGLGLDRNLNLRLVIAWGMLFIGGQYALVSYLVLDLSGRVELTLATASLMLVLAQLGGIVGRILWGFLSDRHFASRRRPPLLALNAIACAMALSLALASPSESLVLIAFTAFVAGVSMIGWQGVWMSLVSELAPPAAIGGALGYGLTFTNLAIVAWPPLFGLIADLTGGFELSWALLGAALCVSGLIMLLVREASAPGDAGGDNVGGTRGAIA